MVTGADEDGGRIKPGQLLRYKGGQGTVGMGMLVEVTGDQDKTDALCQGQVDEPDQGGAQLSPPQAGEALRQSSKGPSQVQIGEL